MNKQKTYLQTFKLLFPFLWPNKRSDLRKRVSLALICLIIAKVASVYTPLILGRSVDSLTELSSGINLLMLIPIALIISYGVARIASLTFEGMRDALFSKVSQHAIREVSLTIFKHLHSLFGVLSKKLSKCLFFLLMIKLDFLKSYFNKLTIQKIYYRVRVKWGKL